MRSAHALVTIAAISTASRDSVTLESAEIVFDRFRQKEPGLYQELSARMDPRALGACIYDISERAREKAALQLGRYRVVSADSVVHPGPLTYDQAWQCVGALITDGRKLGIQACDL